MRSFAAGLALVALLWQPAHAQPRDDLANVVRTLTTRIGAMLTEARRARDAARISCLDDKLSRAHALAAQARPSPAPRMRRALRLRAREIALAAEACERRGPGQREAPGREVVVDPSVPAGDPTLLDEPGYIVDRPPSASGYY